MHSLAETTPYCSAASRHTSEPPTTSPIPSGPYPAKNAVLHLPSLTSLTSISSLPIDVSTFCCLSLTFTTYANRLQPVDPDDPPTTHNHLLRLSSNQRSTKPIVPQTPSPASCTGEKKLSTFRNKANAPRDRARPPTPSQTKAWPIFSPFLSIIGKPHTLPTPFPASLSYPLLTVPQRPPLASPPHHYQPKHPSSHPSSHPPIHPQTHPQIPVVTRRHLKST